MPQTVISVEHLTKRYDLGVIGTGTISRDLNRWWARVRGNPDPYAKIGEVDHGNREGESIRALDDVSFKVEQGEVLGIIGRNGAGKSTLLKILSQVTAPTSGVVKIKGRVGSLLEVGTGFHPELTGRENVYLNGAILGMTRAEVDRKFDEIVEFSGVERYIDTPVKRYSSGMHVRLAFAVAAHLDPEILIVDEVLAVGDAEFQRKCLGKMGEVAGEGRTVLFVSHNVTMIQQLSGKAMYLDNGRIGYYGNLETAINRYINNSGQAWNSGLNTNLVHDGTKNIITAVGIRGNSDDEYKNVIATGEEVSIDIFVNSGEEEIDGAVIGFNTISMERVLTVATYMDPEFICKLVGKGVFSCTVRDFPLVDGDYFISVAVKKTIVGNNLDYIERAVKFRVSLNNYFSTGISLLPGQGIIAKKTKWVSIP